MLEWDDWMCGWAAMVSRGRPSNEGDTAVGRLLSVGQGLIELDVWDRLRICGIEPGGLIEPQVGLGRGAGGTQGRGRLGRSR